VRSETLGIRYARSAPYSKSAPYFEQHLKSRTPQEAMHPRQNIHPPIDFSPVRHRRDRSIDHRCTGRSAVPHAPAAATRKSCMMHPCTKSQGGLYLDPENAVRGYGSIRGLPRDVSAGETRQRRGKVAH